MPNRAFPFHRTTKKLPFFLLLWCIFTMHISNCVIVVLLYVLNWIFAFLVGANCSFISLGINILYMCQGIIVHHYLYLFYMVMLLKLDLMIFFKFAVIIEHLLLKLLEFIFTVSI